MSPVPGEGTVRTGPERPRWASRRPRSAPEDSLRLRLVVLGTVIVAMAAVVAQGAVDGFTAVATLALAPVGYAYSYRRRHEANVGTKAILAVALLAAFGAFLRDVRGAVSVDDARVALAALFLWVQVLHSFDVPRRRDLAFSVVSSLILMAEAASLSFDLAYLAFLVPYTVLAGCWLFLSARPAPAALTPATVRPDRAAGPGATGSLARRLSATGVAVLLVAVLVFMATPRLPGAAVAAPPFSLGGRTPVPGFEGQVVNPGLPEAADPGEPPRFLPDAYPGFGEGVDLRSRGRLGDRVVLRVRSPEASLWRGQAYDHFDGVRWSASDPQTIQVGRGVEESSIRIPTPEHWPDGQIPRRRLIQTFFVRARQPNVVFGAAIPTEVYFPAGTLRVDRFGSIRAPILLEEGTVYSVVSQVPVPTPWILRRQTGGWSAEDLERYTQLPSTTTERVRALAHRIVVGAPTTYDEVVAVESWLRRNTVYDLSVPPDPPGDDPIDRFLFETRRGYCEQIATAMAVLLRELGIPTRLVVGFGPGERNLLTGYFEVRDRDAHAWLEVLYPGAGWIPYDPTFGVPEVAPGLGERFVAPQALRAVGAFLSTAVPEPVRRAARAVGSTLVSAAREAFGAWPALAALAAAGVVATILRRRAAGRRRGGPPPTGAAAAFVDLDDVLGTRGLARRAQETPEEHLARLSTEAALGEDALRDARSVIRAFERERFSPSPPDAGEIEAARSAADRVRVRLARRPPAATIR